MGTACCLTLLLLVPAILYLVLYNTTERITASALPHEGGSRLVLGGENSVVIRQIAEWARALKDDPEVLASPGIPDALPALEAQEDAASRTFAHEPGEGEALWWIGMLATIKATAEQTGGRYTLVEVLAPEGFASPLHVHHFEDEGFWILEGEMTFYVGDQTVKARPGSFLFGPKEVPHAFTVDSGPARLLFVLSPAGFEDLVREMGEPARELTIPPQPQAPPDEAEMQRMAAIAARHGNEILGPPPVQ